MKLVLHKTYIHVFHNNNKNVNRDCITRILFPVIICNELSETLTGKQMSLKTFIYRQRGYKTWLLHLDYHQIEQIVVQPTRILI